MRTIKLGNLTEHEAGVLLRAVEELRSTLKEGTPGERAAEKLQMRLGKLILTGGEKKREM